MAGEDFANDFEKTIYVSWEICEKGVRTEWVGLGVGVVCSL